MLSKAQAEFLQSIDTPTVCNILEVVAPHRRGFGYTVKHLHCIFPNLPPMVGFARTVTIRTKDRVPLGEADYMQKRLDYLDYVGAPPQPCIAVIEDLDGPNRRRGALSHAASPCTRSGRRRRRFGRRSTPASWSGSR